MQFSDSRRAFLNTGRSLAISALLSVFLLRAEEPLPSAERLQTSPILRHLKKNVLASPAQSSAEQTVAQMYVPEGFRAELVVAEPSLHQPIAFSFDERGRIWVAEAYSYPQKRLTGQGLDRILILEDGDGDGRFESSKIFIEGLNLVSGFEVGFGGVWVGAAPELLFIPDRNHDDVPDGAPEVLLDGFGFQDTHECLNSFLWGPDGWLYGNQGVFNYARIGKPGAPDNGRVELRAGVWRYHPVRHEFEVFAHGGSNQWGLDFDERGQIFMTHCRSYWGRGMTTHVIQGGHFWNQANANYAPYIIASPPSDFPEFRNYMLASAQYGHGAGGAGKRGSDAIYGGHSHVGTMIYLGDNWPDEYRGHLFTHNLGGHQINQQINKRLGSGFETVHAGRDQLFCSDPKYVAVDLQYGPDGAVYMIDWYDRQHCHNPNTEQWDRGNGRLYRLRYDKTYTPRKVDLGRLSDVELVELHQHKSEWFVRTARRLLNERSLRRSIDPKAVEAMEELALRDADSIRRLRAMWTLYAIGRFSDTAGMSALADSDEFVRAWGIQLQGDYREVSGALRGKLLQLAKTDPSPTVRLYLASATQRLPHATAWEIIEALSQHSEDRDDRNLPFMIWYGIAQRMPHAPALDRAFAVAAQTKIPVLADFIHWYAATVNFEGLVRVIERLNRVEGEDQRRMLSAISLAMDRSAAITMPAPWNQVAPKLYASQDVRVQKMAQRLAAVFGDNSMFAGLRETLADASASGESRQHAFAVLSRAQDSESLPVFLRLLDDANFRVPAINLLARFGAETIPTALLNRYETFNPAERLSALNTLTGRSNFALPLLDAVAAGQMKRDELTAFYISRLLGLNNPEVNNRVNAAWGKIQRTPVEKQAQIEKLEHVFNEAPLWAYAASEGHKHFQKLCSQCHRVGEDGTRVGPELTGAGKNGIRYYLENIIDPNAVIGLDYQMTSIETDQGEIVSGLVINETPATLTVQTTTEQLVLAKSSIALRSKSELSLMPESLIDSLNDRERLELLKFLTSN
ncbi:MAG: dehydrogenase [Verrucomicrobia bacterium]|nr:dehydrogenase [Verrucomicrobiota bacterium]